MLENMSGDGPHGSLIFDQEDGFCAFPASGRGAWGAVAISLLSGGRLNCRQEHPEFAAQAHLAVDLDPSIMLFDKAIDSGQTQPSAFPNIFGGKKWLE